VSGTSTVAIIDGGGANIASLRFALERLGYSSVLTTSERVISGAKHVILPGVGAARAAMQRLQASGLDQVIPRLTQPVLGICLGMQLLFDASEEDDARCLGIIAGTARRFQAAADRPVPHMGWNLVRRTRDTRLLRGIQEDCYCYFVHSYAIPLAPPTVASTIYGWEFSAIVEKDNFVATQFHPERSGEAGAKILRNFLSDS
jgi:glutamine amidotransferase